MKILYLGDALSIHTQRWVNYFARNNFDVMVVSNRGESFNGIPVKNLEKIKYPQKYFELKRTVHRFKPDIIHSHYVTSYGFWGLISGFHPFVVTAWGSDILVTSKKHWLLRQLTKFTLQQADLITVDSRNMINEIVALGCDSNKIHLIQWGVDLAQFNPDGKIKARQELGFQDKFIILSTRSLEKNYNIDYILKAFAEVAQEIPTAILVVVSDGSEKENLMDLAKKLNLLPRIIFTGHLSYEKIAQYYKAADVFVSIPTSDATAMSLLEAMVCGLSVIVSDLPANREWIKNGENGFLVYSHDLRGLTWALKELYSNPLMRENFGKINYEIVKNKANHEVEMKKMEKLYTNLV